MNSTYRTLVTTFLVGATTLAFGQRQNIEEILEHPSPSFKMLKVDEDWNGAYTIYTYKQCEDTLKMRVSVIPFANSDSIKTYNLWGKISLPEFNMIGDLEYEFTQKKNGKVKAKKVTWPYPPVKSVTQTFEVGEKEKLLNCLRTNIPTTKEAQNIHWIRMPLSVERTDTVFHNTQKFYLGRTKKK